MLNPVVLVDKEGGTSIHIEAGITDTGDLLISGQDLGEAPRQSFGDSDYEYWLRIPSATKDRVLLALLEKCYADDPQVVSRLQAYLQSKGIETTFYCH